MHGIDKLIDEIRRRWLASKVLVRAGATEDAVCEFEKVRGIRVPTEFKKFYCLMDGMESGAADSDWNSFWPLAEINSVTAILTNHRGIPDYGEIATALPDASSYFAFADHSIWLNVFALRLDGKPTNPALVIGINGSNWWPIANSFGDFLRLYSDKPMSIL